MTIDEVYNLTKKTMTNWEVEPTYSSGLVEAMYGYPSNTNFSVEIEVQSEDVVDILDKMINSAKVINAFIKSQQELF